MIAVVGLMGLSFLSGCKTPKGKENSSPYNTPTDYSDDLALPTEASNGILIGKWVSSCLLRSPGLYARTVLTFADADLSLSSSYFVDDKCKTAAGSEILQTRGVNQTVAQGTYRVGAIAADGKIEIDLHFKAGSAYTVVKVDGNKANFGKLCKKADITRGLCKVEAGQDIQHRARTLDPISVYTRLK